jgi:hypothetical protein
MGALNPNSYRKHLIKKLEESDNYTKEEKVVMKNRIILGEMRGTPLDALRKKLFTDDEDILSRDGADMASIDGEDGQNLLLGGDNLEDMEDTEDTEDTEDVQDMEDMEDTEDVQDMEDVEETPSSSNRNLDDVVSDTILEILTKFKEIRDTYVEQDPQKADIVRKVYDYLFKAKDKIANEINKDNTTPNQPLQQKVDTI